MSPDSSVRKYGKGSDYHSPVVRRVETELNKMPAANKLRPFSDSLPLGTMRHH
jgi:hypothetical protein